MFFVARLLLLPLLAGFGVLSGPVNAREMVRFEDGRFRPGTILVRTTERRLYLIGENGQALRYTIAVGKSGRQWQGQKYIEEKQIEPAWAPPAMIRRDKPHLPAIIPPGPDNPLGAAALGLGPGGQYAIHGTNAPGSIGQAASYGCIRMHNHDILDLYARVRVGTPVIVMP
jgi:lipoprotein-anchoring transpeptidase ErfK/SrfK